MGNTSSKSSRSIIRLPTLRKVTPRTAAFFPQTSVLLTKMPILPPALEPVNLDTAPRLLQAAPFAALPWLRHGFTDRRGGITGVYGSPNDLNLGLTKEDDPAVVHENRRRLLQAATGNAHGWTLANTRQIHSSHLLNLTPESPHPTVPADGLITSFPGTLLTVLAADCVPVLLADTRLRVVAAIHAGWRGTVARIVEKAVRTMREFYASDPEDLLAAIGPSIGPCCYLVGDEVQARFHTEFPYAPSLFTARAHLDLWTANRRHLLESGIPPANITVLGQCTACSLDAPGRLRFFSHRAENSITGRMMAVIGVSPQDPQIR